jgi:multidrug efflux pump
MASFNLSSWALRNQALVLYSIILLALVGTLSYRSLGQAEDPPFTFKVMVVQTQWPGSTAQQISEQVTETIEKKLQEIPELDYLRSYSRPGESQVFFVVKDSIDPARVDDVWYQVRKKVADIHHALPSDIRGPFFNDEFGDTFGNIYALTGDGFDDAELRDYAERVKLELLRVPNVAKIDLIGRQDPKIHVEIPNAKLATLGVSFAELQRTSPRRMRSSLRRQLRDTERPDLPAHQRRRIRSRRSAISASAAAMVACFASATLPR